MTITILSALESHLWETANILRGNPVDRTEWKSYSLPLMFFKRVCDVWDEEYEENCAVSISHYVSRLMSEDSPPLDVASEGFKAALGDAQEAQVLWRNQITKSRTI